MKQIGSGILPDSEIYFASPSERAQRLYYNILCAGHFYCDSSYHLVRESYDSILVLYIVDGTFTYRGSDGKYITAKKDDTVVLDCYSPHEYLTKDKLESVWLHISGADSRDLCREICSSNSNHFTHKNYEYIKELIFSLVDSLRSENISSEAEISLRVYRLFLELINTHGIKNKSVNRDKEGIQPVKEYISLHLGEKITVRTLADILHMSSTNFSRVFKAQTGFSPYDYVFAARLNKAKELLLTTDKAVTEIAYETGFNSQANFVYAFTKNEGVSPGKFRKFKF